MGDTENENKSKPKGLPKYGPTFYISKIKIYQMQFLLCVIVTKLNLCGCVWAEGHTVYKVHPITGILNIALCGDNLIYSPWLWAKLANSHKNLPVALSELFIPPKGRLVLTATRTSHVLTFTVSLRRWDGDRRIANIRAYLKNILKIQNKDYLKEKIKLILRAFSKVHGVINGFKQWLWMKGMCPEHKRMDHRPLIGWFWDDQYYENRFCVLQMSAIKRCLSHLQALHKCLIWLCS